MRMSPPLELTLVLAATREMGIGRGGTLPWTGLKKEMAYFARVTKRLPAHIQSPTALNAVIMGRKTWDSIPPRFRPLKSRLNVVISRSFAAAPETGAPAAQESVDVTIEPVRAASLEQALEYLRNKPTGTLGRVFVIGGSQIYTAALELQETCRILLTRVVTDFPCDTFFPLTLADDKESGGNWIRKPAAELNAWTGEEVAAGMQEENGTQYEFQMWERTS